MNRSLIQTRLVESREPKASALLISLLLMTFLLIFGLGLSQLVIDAIRVERNVVDAGKAYFSAESGIEVSLYYRENRLPGYEIQNDDSVENEDIELSNGTTVTYEMIAAESQVPCSHSGEDAWREVGIQDSVSLPLYHWDPDEISSRGKVSKFELSFNIDRGDSYNGVNGDVLRWKILGIDTSGGHTEAISGLLDYDSNDAASNVLTSDDTASFYDGVSGATFVYDPTHPISTFLEDHYLNTLVITNIVSLNAQDSTVQEAEDNVVEFQFVVPDGETTTCEYTLISADGMSDGVKQSIDVQVKLDSFLPVFNFALYHTD